MRNTFLLFFISFSFSVGMMAQNVGIGVPAPLGKLHIKVNSTTSIPQLRLTEEGDDFARIKMESDKHPGAFWDIAAKANTDTGLSLLNFYFANGTNSGDRMTISGIGNVGIGNTNPQSKLDIASNGDGKELLRFSMNTRPFVFRQIGDGTDTNLGLQAKVNGKDFKIMSADSISAAAIFELWNDDPRVLLVPENGRVGIGTPSLPVPGNLLRVNGRSTSDQHVFSVSSNYTGTNHVRAVESFSDINPGYGYAGFFRGGFRGVYGYADGGSRSARIIGVEGAAVGTGTAGERIGVYGTAVGGSSNWAAYFDAGHTFVTNDLRIGLGAKNGAAGYKVAIDGKAIAEEVRVQLSGDWVWPDYVFKEDYKLLSLPELEESIDKLGHLPGVPSAAEVKNEGILLGDMNRILLEKIEELTLHVISLQKEIDELKKDK